MSKDTPINLDPEMLEMFSSECRDNFEQVEDSLLVLEEHGHDPEQLNTLFRALHTIKGVSNMMGFDQMGRLAHKAEELAGIFRDEGVSVTQEGTDALFKAVDVLRDMAEEAVNDKTNPYIPDQGLLEDIEKLCRVLRGESSGNAEKGEDQEELQNDAQKEVEDQACDDHKTSENLEAFLFFVDEELPALKRLLDSALKDGDWNEVLQKVGMLEFAASDLGFKEIAGMFSEFKEMADSDQDKDSDTLLGMYARIEQACMGVKGISPKDTPKDTTEDTHEDITEDTVEDSVSEHSQLFKEAQSIEANSQDSVDGESISSIEDELFDTDEALVMEIDDDDLSAFLVFLEEEYPKLLQAMTGALQEGKWEDLKKTTDIIEYAARQLKLENFADTLKAIRGLGEDRSEDKTVKMVELEKVLSEELLALKQIAEKRGIFAGPSEKDLSSIFVQRVITDAEAMNGRLKECADAIDDSLNLMGQGMDVDIDRSFFEEAVSSLKLLYHFCIFYEIDKAAETVLLLEDIYNRMAQDEIAPDPEVSKITSDLVQLMSDTFEALRKGQGADDSSFSEIFEMTKRFVSSLPENRVAGISSQFLHLLDVSPGFHEVATPESNAKVAEALKEGLFFYEIMVDLDSNPEVAGDFMALEDRLTFITNETIYEGDITKYNFLVASSLGEDAIREALLAIFKEDNLFDVRRCRPKDDASDACNEMPGNDTTVSRHFDHGDGLDEALLAKLGKCVEEVSAVSSSVHHVVNVIEQMDFEELFGKLLNIGSLDHNEKWQLNELMLQLRNIVQADRHLVTALEELHKNVGQLVTVETLELLEWIALQVRHISAAKGLQIAINIEDNNTRISRELINSLRKPIKKLVGACVETAGQSKGKARLHIISKNVGDSVAIELRASYYIDKELAVSAIKSADSFLDSQIITLAHIENGFSIRIANCNAIVHGIVMQKSGINYVVPVHSIKRILEPANDDITVTSCDDGYKILRMEDELVSVRPIIGQDTELEDKQKELLVVVESHSGLVAYEVDEIVGQEQLRVMPLSGHLSSINGAAGCAILGNGDVGIVLDVG